MHTISSMALGIGLGLLMPWVYRIAREALAGRREVYLEIGKERVEMLTRDEGRADPC